MPEKKRNNGAEVFKKRMDRFLGPERWEKVTYIVAATFIAVAVSFILQANGAQVATAPVNALQGKTIVLDAGHGGTDGGATSLDGSLTERELNLEIAFQVEAILKERGADVIMTRKTQDALAQGKRPDMEARREIIQQPGVDAMISIHLNANPDRSAKGPMTYYYDKQSQGKVLAECLERTLVETLEPETRRGSRAGDFYVLRAGQVPSAMVECGFITNADEAQLLQDEEYQMRIAEAVAAGLEIYFGMGTMS